MTNLVSAMAQAGMSLEDLEILKQATNGGNVDLGFTRASELPITIPVTGNQNEFLYCRSS